MNEPKLYADLDGVFADFVTASCVIHNQTTTYLPTHYDYWTDWGMTAEEFWVPIRELGEEYYREYVPAYPWAQGLCRLFEEFDPNFVFASVAGATNPHDYSGKVAWVRQYLSGGDYRVIVVPPDCKHLLAGPGRILVDDSRSNVEQWRDAGGDAVLFPQPWNFHHPAERVWLDRVEIIRHELENIYADQAIEI